MNKRLIILVGFICVVALLCGCAKSPREQLIGTWEGKSNSEEPLIMVLNADGTGSVGEGDKRKDFTWTMDATKTPMHMDVKFEKRARYMIFRFLPGGKAQFHDGNTRPSEFKDQDYFKQVTFTKTK